MLNAIAQLDRPIDGVYELQAKCGTACNSLYRRVESQEAENIYFFLDPTRSGDAKEDSFVFATTCDRIEYGSSRPILAKTSPGWRSEQHEGDENVELVLPSIWRDMHDARFSRCSDATPTWLTEKIARPANKLELSAGTLACQSAQLLLSADVQPPASAEERPWLRPTWTNIDVLHQGPEVFDALGWIVARSQSLAAVKDWQALALEVVQCCSRLFVDADVWRHRNRNACAKSAARQHRLYNGCASLARRQTRSSQSKMASKPVATSKNSKLARRLLSSRPASRTVFSAFVSR